MTKTVVITQSNYLPWRGYFDLIRSADEFILLDCVQYTRRDWRNRNIIKTASGPAWLTVPVRVKGKYYQAVDETKVADLGWVETHLRTISLNYKRASSYDEVAPWLRRQLTLAANEELLTRVNEHLIRAICARLGIAVPIRRCVELVRREELQGMSPTERLVALCRATGATRYLSGPTAESYLDRDRFTEVGIEVTWMSYKGYSDYPQPWGDFEPKVSIIDLMLNTGTAAPRFLDRRLFR